MSERLLLPIRWICNLGGMEYSADLAKDVALRLVAGPLSRAPVVKSDEAVVDALGTLLACMQTCLFSQGGLSCIFSSRTPKQASTRCCQAPDMSQARCLGRRCDDGMAAEDERTWEVAVHDLAPLVEVLHNVLLRDLIRDAAHIQARAAAVCPSWRRRLRILQRCLPFSVCGWRWTFAAAFSACSRHALHASLTQAANACKMQEERRQQHTSQSLCLAQFTRC